MHGRVWRDLPKSVQAQRFMGEAAVSECPVDAVDFLKLFPRVKHDFVITVLVALLKEPRATQEFQSAAIPSTLAALEEVLTKCLANVDGAPHTSELNSLTKQVLAG